MAVPSLFLLFLENTAFKLCPTKSYFLLLHNLCNNVFKSFSELLYLYLQTQLPNSALIILVEVILFEHVKQIDAFALTMAYAGNFSLPNVHIETHHTL